jgi:hypothetical protein
VSRGVIAAAVAGLTTSMRRSMTLAITIVLTCALPVVAQEAPVAEATEQPSVRIPDTLVSNEGNVLGRGTSEWMVTVGPAWGVVIFHSAAGHRYAMETISWGHVLTDHHGSGAWRGNFEWAIETVPVYNQSRPTSTFGVGVSPMVWRWNFEPRGKLAPFGELAGGALFTRDPVPARTTKANFTAHAGAGLRIFIRPREALILSYRFHHISNGNRVEPNPGVNAHVLQFGWTHVRPRR